MNLPSTVLEAESMFGQDANTCVSLPHMLSLLELSVESKFGHSVFKPFIFAASLIKLKTV